MIKTELTEDATEKREADFYDLLWDEMDRVYAPVNNVAQLPAEEECDHRYAMVLGGVKCILCGHFVANSEV